MNKFIALVLVSLLCGCALGGSNMRGIEQLTCKNGVQTCIQQCACGFGYTVCAEGKWYIFNSPAGTVCVQNKTEVYFEPIADRIVIEEVCGNKYKGCANCINGRQKCVKECDCYSGYNECVNGEYIHVNVDNKVCKQVNPMSIELVVPGSPKCSKPTGNCVVPQPITCLDGQERCIKDCSCGFGYEICSNNKWYKISIPEGTVCAQVTKMNVTLVAINDDEQIHEYCPTGLHNCVVTTPKTQPFGCMNGNEKCDDQCVCGAGYEVCDHNIWVHLGAPKGTVCSQITPTNISLVSIYDPQIDNYCPTGVHGNCEITHTTEPFICYEGVERCDDECTCGFGYKVCDHNKWVHMEVPNGAVCAQATPRNITLVAIDDNKQIADYCPTGLHGNCQISTETEPFVCVNGVEKCQVECGCGFGYVICDNNKWVHLEIPKGSVCAQESLTQIVLVATNDEEQIKDYCPNGLVGTCGETTQETHPFVCYDGVERCDAECTCGVGYRICDNNNWVHLPIPKGTVCAQLSYGNISLVALNDPYQIHMCPTGLHGDCGITTPETEPFVCNKGDERCEAECTCSVGYDICDNNKWVYFPVPNGAVCAQDTPINITLVAINDDKQISEYCPSGLHKCDTTVKTTHPIICIEGEERCDDSCTCGVGYRVCDNNQWVHLKVPEGSVCAQDTRRNITLVAINDEAQIHKYCREGLEHCHISTKTTQPLVCIEGEERCDDSCTCGVGYKVCDNNQWVHLNVPKGSVCAQDTRRNITLVAINDDLQIQKYCPNGLEHCGESSKTTEPLVCYEGIERCDDSCTCGAGYRVCDNNQWVHLNVPKGSVCAQDFRRNITLVSINDDVQIQKYCPNGLERCGESTKTTEPLVCIDGYEKCQNECNCESGYYMCAENKWVLMPISPKTICAQNGSSVILEYACPDFGDQGKCAGKVTGNCHCTVSTTFNDPSSIIDNNVCAEPNGYFCKNECRIQSGYYHCVSGNAKYYPISEKVVCWQSEVNAVQLVHANSDDGNQFGCSGKVYLA